MSRPVRGFGDSVGEDLQVVAQVDAVLDHVLDELVVVEGALAHLGQEVAVRSGVPEVPAAFHQFEGEAGGVVEGLGERLRGFFDRCFGILSGEVKVVRHGAGALAEVEPSRECAGDVVLRTADRFFQVVPLREVRCDGARQRASGAVGVRVVDPIAMEPLRAVRRPEEVVGVVEVVAAF